jgi:release factor glutamine methyltransferase
MKPIVSPPQAWMMMTNKLLSENLLNVLDATATRLSTESDTPQLDAEVLVAHILKQPRTWLLAHDDTSLNQEQSETLESLLQRLERGEPLPYAIGHWEFFGLDFELTPDVLIPRPETELLVERAIPWLQSSSQRRSIADIGTGSGCIAISIATHVPTAQILATDISSAALEVARRNALKYKVENQIEFIECDILPQPFSPLPQGEGLGVRVFDLICANLPYIPTEKLHTLPVYGREPTLALDGGDDGLDLFRRLLALTPKCLASGGRMLLEIEATRGPAALSLAYDAFDEAEIHLYQDLAQQDRLLEIQLPLE